MILDNSFSCLLSGVQDTTELLPTSCICQSKKWWSKRSGSTVQF